MATGPGIPATGSPSVWSIYPRRCNLDSPWGVSSTGQNHQKLTVRYSLILDPASEACLPGLRTSSCHFKSLMLLLGESQAPASPPGSHSHDRQHHCPRAHEPLPATD